MKKLNLILYYLLSFTWGITMNIIGLFAFTGALIVGGKPMIFHGRFVVKVGSCWGGVSLGNFILTDQDWEWVIKHETGHTIQNAWMGPFFLFLVGIPSVVRYWYRELKYYRYNVYPPTEYDSVWFESSATLLGNKYVDRREKQTARK